MRRSARSAGAPRTASRFCPRCGCIGAYAISKRRQFECKGCKHHFSVTAQTIFASRKMAFVHLLAAICIFVNGAKGISALQLSRDLDCQ
jgi:transposase-like protein